MRSRADYKPVAMVFLPTAGNFAGICYIGLNMIYLAGTKAFQRDYVQNLTGLYLLLVFFARFLHHLASRNVKRTELLKELAGALFAIGLFCMTVLSFLVFADLV